MALAFVSRVNNGVVASATTIASPARAHVTGNLLVACVACTDTQTITGLADTAGNTWTQVGTDLVSSSRRLTIWYAKNITGHATNVVTVTYSASVGNRVVTVYEFSGAHTTSPFHEFDSDTGSSTSISTGPFTITESFEVIVTFMRAVNNTITGGSGTLTTFNLTGSASVVWADQYDIVTATGSQTASCASGAWAICGASFKIAGSVAATRVDATMKIEAELSPSTWSNLSADVVAEPGVSFSYGIPGNRPDDVVASAGQLNFSLRNDAGCSGGVQGYYSPSHANKRAGWTFAVPVRVTFTYDSVDYVKFYGKVREIDVDAGRYGSQRVHVTAYDTIRDLAQAGARETTIQIAKTEAELIEHVLSVIPSTLQPLADDISPGVDVFPVAFDQVGDETKALALIAQAVISADGRYFQKGDGTHTYKTRHELALAGSGGTLTDDDLESMSAPASEETAFNRVRLTFHPKDLDGPSDEVVFSQVGEPPSVPPSGSITIWSPYFDPDDPSVPIGATGTIAPVATTDYLGNTLSDGTGTDKTADLSITCTRFGSTSKWVITNNASQTVYVTHRQLRGTAIRDIGAQVVESFSAQDYDHTLAIDLPLQDDANITQSRADYLRALWEQPENQIDEVGFLANRSDTLMSHALLGEPGDKYTIIETVTGIERDVYLQSVAFDVSDGLIRVRWGLAPAPTITTKVLDHATLGVLDVAVLGYA